MSGDFNFEIVVVKDISTLVEQTNNLVTSKQREISGQVILKVGIKMSF